ncbi:hypothetical protein ACVW1C_006018 [Bradyrhizobium sp. USDA 4011]
MTTTDRKANLEDKLDVAGIRSGWSIALPLWRWRL